MGEIKGKGNKASETLDRTDRHTLGLYKHTHNLQFKHSYLDSKSSLVVDLVPSSSELPPARSSILGVIVVSSLTEGT